MARLKLPDPDDRHALAAIQAKASAQRDVVHMLCKDPETTVALTVLPSQSHIH